MSDPFLPENSRSQLIREAKIGFSVVLLVMGTLACWGWVQYRNIRHSIPEHVRNAPVAKHVGPDEYLSHLTELAKTGNSLPGTNDPPAVPSVAMAAPNNASRIPNAASDRQPQPASFATEPGRIIRVPLDVDNLDPETNRTDPDEVQRELTDVTSNAMLGNVDGNPDPRDEIGHSFAAARDSAVDAPESTGTIVEYVNPVAHPMAEDLSRRLKAFEKSIQSETNDFVPERQRVLETAQAAIDGVKQDEGELLRQDPLVTPAGFDTDHEQRETNAPPPQNESGDVELAGDLPSDDQWSLQVVDPSDADSTTNGRPVARKMHNEPAGEMESGETRRVRGGDTLWGIAQRQYGDGGYFRALHELNRNRIGDVGDIPAGLIIQTPSAAVLRNRFPELCPTEVDADTISGQIYTTKAGDNLFTIARQTTGQASRYLELLQLNRDRLSAGTDHLTRLPANLELRLPIR